MQDTRGEYLRNEHADDFSSGYNTTIYTLVWLVGACSCQHFACPYEYTMLVLASFPGRTRPGYKAMLALVQQKSN